MRSNLKKLFTFNIVYLFYFTLLAQNVDFVDDSHVLVGLIALTIVDLCVKLNVAKEQKQNDLILNNLPIFSILSTRKGKLLHHTGNINSRCLNNYHNKYTNEIKSEDETIIREKKPLCALRKFEADFKGEQWHKILKMPILNKFGKVEQILTFGRNVENELNEEEKKNTFIATMVHDLKNPITAQIKILEILIKQDKKEGAPEREEIHAQMLTSARNLFEIVMSTLNTYKYDKGEIQFDFQKCNLAELIEEVCAEKTHLTNESKELSLQLNAKSKLAKADKMHLRRVIGNIVANAIHYRKENSKILVELTSDEQYLFFKVTNEGYYIKPELQSEIFKKYVSKSAKFNSIGTGLGLYIAKKIVIAHHGEMLINSTKDGLNTFGFKIPKLSQSAKLELATPHKCKEPEENSLVYL